MADPFLGEIKIVSFDFPPRGWASCSGQLLPINQNQALFSLLGTTYGGNGTTTFALPDFRSRVPVHWGNGSGLPMVSQGERSGEENHNLLISELPAHTHPVYGDANPASSGSPANATWAANELAPYGASQNVEMGPDVVSSVGGSQAHPNMQPYLTLNFVIALQGIFPPRD